MYVKLRSSFQIVSLPDDFLTLTDVSDDGLHFDVKYQYDQERGIKQNATKITIDISKTMPPPASSTANALGRDVAKSVLTAFRDHVSALADYFKNSVVETKNSDPTVAVSNEIVHLFSKGYSLDQLPQARARAFVVKPTSKVPDALRPIEAQHDVGVDHNGERQLAEDLLVAGMDPVDSYEQNELGLTLQEAYTGTHKKSPVVFDNREQKLLYRYKNLPFLKPVAQTSPGEPGPTVNPDPPKDLFTVVPSQEISTTVAVIEPVSFAYDQTKDEKFYLTIKVADVDDVTIQTIVRAFEPGEYVKYRNIPKRAPFVKAAGYSDKSHALVAVRQLDPNAKSVKIYQRVYDHHTLADQPYVFVTEFDIAREDGWKYVPIEISFGNTLIYRFVASDRSGAVGSDFASLVLKPTLRDSNIKRAIAVITPQLNGATISVTHLPTDCVSFQVIREDVTVHGRPEFVSTPTYVDTSDPNREYLVEDTDVKQNHVYRYRVRLFRKNGSSFERLVATYQHYALVENLVDTKLVNVRTQLTDLGYDVKFTIQTSVVATDVDRYKLLLQRQGIYDLFNGDVKEARDQLGKLLAHNVRRVDLITGAVEDFGTITDTEFSDLTARKVAGVSDPVSGGRYRYEVIALLRTPETMLDTFVKSETDPTSGRTYQYSPFKFLHPAVSLNGNLISNASLRAHYANDPMTFGLVGNYASADVALNTQLPNAQNVTREQFGSNLDVLKWNLQGSSNDVDHFQILIEHGGTRRVVGKFICLPDTQSFQYVRSLSKFETGIDLRYYVLPVYHDFTRGASVLASNTNKGDQQ